MNTGRERRVQKALEEYGKGAHDAMMELRRERDEIR